MKSSKAEYMCVNKRKTSVTAKLEEVKADVFKYVYLFRCFLILLTQVCLSVSEAKTITWTWINLLLEHTDLTQTTQSKVAPEEKCV